MSSSDYASTPGHAGRDTRATKAAPDGDDGELAALQRTAGNQAVGALIQAKLQVGAVDDPFEREADRVARKVVAVQHQHDGPVCGACGPAEGAAIRRSAAGGAGPGGGSLDEGTDRAIRTAGGGRTLDSDVQRSMESGFGADFSGVRVHDDATSDGLNRELGARAFTTGADIFFRQGEYAPDTAGGKELLAHELTHVVQQGAATVADGAEVQRSAEGKVQRKAYQIGSTREHLEVSRSMAEEDREALLTEAEEILAEVKSTYGVRVSSRATVRGIKSEYTEVPREVLKSLSTKAWRIGELRALKRALSYYSAILGDNREESARKDIDQELTSVGKVRQAINKDTPAGRLDTTTLGEYFASKKNLGLFKASEKHVADFDTLEDQLTGTFVHEVAHGLLAYAIPDYIKATGYWRKRYKALAPAKQTEEPITKYGRKNAAEDLCEAAMVFFIEPERLEKKCPLRYAFMVQLGKDWLPPPAEAPQVQPEAKGEEPALVSSPKDVEPPLELVEVVMEIDKLVEQVDRRPEDADAEEAPEPARAPESSVPAPDLVGKPT